MAAVVSVKVAALYGTPRCAEFRMIIIHFAPKRNRRGARGKVKPGYVGKGRIRASGVYWDLLRITLRGPGGRQR